MADNNDIGKIVSLIMENPHIIDEISALVKSSKDTQVEPVTADSTPAEASEPEPINEEPHLQASSPVTLGTDIKRTQREGLINALKPYLSGERARAVDSMMQVASILELMRR